RADAGGVDVAGQVEQPAEVSWKVGAVARTAAREPRHARDAGDRTAGRARGRPARRQPAGAVCLQRARAGRALAASGDVRVAELGSVAPVRAPRLVVASLRDALVDPRLVRTQPRDAIVRVEDVRRRPAARVAAVGDADRAGVAAGAV